MESVKGDQISKTGNKRVKTAGTREHRQIFEGNKHPSGKLSKPKHHSCHDLR